MILLSLHWKYLLYDDIIITMQTCYFFFIITNIAFQVLVNFSVFLYGNSEKLIIYTHFHSCEFWYIFQMPFIFVHYYIYTVYKNIINKSLCLKKTIFHALIQVYHETIEFFFYFLFRIIFFSDNIVWLFTSSPSHYILPILLLPIFILLFSHWGNKQASKK